MSRLSTFLRRALGLLLLLGGIGGASAASASDPQVVGLGSGYTAGDAPLGAPSELRIDLRGRIAARCAMTTPPAFAGPPDLSREGELQAQFALDCNAPFSLRVRSGEGGLATEQRVGGEKRIVPYELAMIVDTDAGSNSLGWCGAAALTGQGDGGCAFGDGAGWSSGDATAINRTGSIRLRWDRPAAAQQLAPGTYRDTLIVEVAVRS